MSSKTLPKCLSISSLKKTFQKKVKFEVWESTTKIDVAKTIECCVKFGILEPSNLTFEFGGFGEGLEEALPVQDLTIFRKCEARLEKEVPIPIRLSPVYYYVD